MECRCRRARRWVRGWHLLDCYPGVILSFLFTHFFLCWSNHLGVEGSSDLGLSSADHLRTLCASVYAICNTGISMCSGQYQLTRDNTYVCRNFISWALKAAAVKN